MLSDAVFYVLSFGENRLALGLIVFEKLQFFWILNFLKISIYSETVGVFDYTVNYRFLFIALFYYLDYSFSE